MERRRHGKLDSRCESSRTTSVNSTFFETQYTGYWIIDVVPKQIPVVDDLVLIIFQSGMVDPKH
jgi:hypothetical protein